MILTTWFPITFQLALSVGSLKEPEEGTLYTATAENVDASEDDIPNGVESSWK